MSEKTTVAVVITSATASGSLTFHAVVDILDRTTTGIRDALAAAGDEASRQYKEMIHS